MKYILALITAPLWVPFVALAALFAFVVYKAIILGIFLLMAYIYLK